MGHEGVEEGASERLEMRARAEELMSWRVDGGMGGLQGGRAGNNSRSKRVASPASLSFAKRT